MELRADAGRSRDSMPLFSLAKLRVGGSRGGTGGGRSNVTMHNDRPAKQSEEASTSTAKPYRCGICLERQSGRDGITLYPCSHKFCASCLVEYIKASVETGKFPINCPSCKVAMDSWKCHSLLLQNNDEEVADQLAALAVEHTAFGDSGPRYCANPQCATPFEYVGDGSPRTQRVVCPLCSVATCMACRELWHEGTPCSNPLREMKEQCNWRNCPRCGELIERIEGCNFIRCRCGTGFCYRCGEPYRKRRGVGANSHGVPGCNCGLFENVNQNQRARQRRGCMYRRNRNRERPARAGDRARRQAPVFDQVHMHAIPVNEFPEIIVRPGQNVQRGFEEDAIHINVQDRIFLPYHEPGEQEPENPPLPPPPPQPRPPGQFHGIWGRVRDTVHRLRAPRDARN